MRHKHALTRGADTQHIKNGLAYKRQHIAFFSLKRVPGPNDIFIKRSPRDFLYSEHRPISIADFKTITEHDSVARFRKR